MDARELALRKCLNVLVSSSTITERKRNIETLVELLKDSRTHDLLDDDKQKESTAAKRSLTWNELFGSVREWTINELANVRSKLTKAQSSDLKYQEALRPFKILIENANSRSLELDGRPLIESIVSIMTGEAWSSCSVVIKELSHVLVNNVLCFHRYANELREQEWIDLCRLFISLTDNQSVPLHESDQALYSSYLKFVVEKLVVYNDLDTNKSSIRKDLLDFFHNKIDQSRNSNNFCLIENLLCALNACSFKYVFDLPDEVYHLGSQLLPSLLDIWRRKCSEKPKTEIIKFSRLQVSLHHPGHRKSVSEKSADVWMKNLRDMNDLILREVDEICHKQRLNSRQTQNEFAIRSDLLHLASSVYYQLALNKSSTKDELMDVDDDESVEPSSKRARYEYSMSISTSTDSQMAHFQNLFQSVDPHHQSAGFQIVSLQIERKMVLSPSDCDIYMNAITRFLADERRQSLLVCALRCLHLLLSRTTHCQLTSDLVALIQPLIHIPVCEAYVIEILSGGNLSLLQLCSCSSLTSLKCILRHLSRYPNNEYSSEDENKLISRLLPDIITSYRNNEYDLSTVFSSHPPEFTYLHALIVMQFSSFDIIPNQLCTSTHQSMQNEFDQIEVEWSRLKLLVPVVEQQHEETRPCFSSKGNTCELNLKIFQRISDIYEKHVRFIQQVKDKHLGERYKMILHYAFMGIHILNTFQMYFKKGTHNEKHIERFVATTYVAFTELTDETNFLFSKNQDIPFVSDLLEHMKNCLYVTSSSSVLQPLLPSLNRFPSVLFGFLDAKLLSYLYNFSTQEPTKKKPTDVEGVQCPADNLCDDKRRLMQTFEILLLLCFQAVHDRPLLSNSLVSKYCLNYETNVNLLIRLLEEKIYAYLEELPLPDPVSFQYVDKFLSHVCFSEGRYYLHIRYCDFEFLANLFSQSFRTYRRDIRLCQRFMHLLYLFIKMLYKTIRENLPSDENWLHTKKIIDVFWQMTINRSILVNGRMRRLILQLKQILIQDDQIGLADMKTVLNDPSHLVRLEANRLCLNLFFDMDHEEPQNVQHQVIERQTTLGIYLGCSEISKESPLKVRFRLKSSSEQKEIYQRLVDESSSPILLYELSKVSEYLSRRVAFDLVELGLKTDAFNEFIEYSLRAVPLECIVQYWHQQTIYFIKDFPWKLLNISPTEECNSFLFASYFVSSSRDRQQLDRIFNDTKSSLIEYFPRLQAFLLPALANKANNDGQTEESRQAVEKLISKTEHNRLMKQKLTMIVSNMLLTYWNNEENEFFDKWSPEPIAPVYSWAMLKTAFDYIKQMANAKTFSELLIKTSDVGEILLCLSSKLIATNSLHEQLRLLNVFALFVTDVLMTAADNDYTHTVLRDSTYILLRFIDQHCRIEYNEIYQQEINDKLLNIVCSVLHKLCSKGFDFDLPTYLRHVPDIVSILVDHDQYLTKGRVQSILVHIYRTIRGNNDPVCVFLAYAIEKLGFLTREIKAYSQPITTAHFFSYLSHRRSSLPVRWVLEMFHDHLENERFTSPNGAPNVDPAMIAFVKQQFINCVTSKHNHVLAGKCLSKCPLFFINNSEENLEEVHYETVPLWVMEDLTMLYLIDKEQTVIECARYTLKLILSHANGQELYQKHVKSDLLQVYLQPLLSQTNVLTKRQLDLTSSTNPWLITSFESWLISLVNFLLKQIEYCYVEKKETGHPYAFLFIQLKHLVQLKLDLAKKLVPYLILCLLSLPAHLNNRQLLTKGFSSLHDQLLKNTDKSNNTYIQVAKLVFQTINFLRQCPIENLNKRNPGKSLLLSFENNFWLDLDYFLLAECASKYQCYQSAVIYIDIWTTKQRSALRTNDHSTHLYCSDMDLLSSSSNLVDLFVRIHSTMKQSDEFHGVDKCFQTRPSLCGEFNQLNSNYYDAVFYYDQASFTIDSSKLVQSLRLCGFNHVLEQYLRQISSLSDQIYYRIQLVSLLTEQRKLAQWDVLDDKSISPARDRILSILQREKRAPSSSITELVNHTLWNVVSDLRECSLVNVIDDAVTNHKKPDVLPKLWSNHCCYEMNEDVFDLNDEILLTRVAVTHHLLLHNDDGNAENHKIKQTLLADVIAQLCRNALDSKKLQLCDRYLSDLSPLIDPTQAHELSFLRAKVLVLRQQDTAGEYLRQLIASPLPDSVLIRCRLLLCSWLNETRCETSTTIKQQLDSIANSIKNLNTSYLSLAFESYLAMAHFSDSEYQRLSQLFHSPMFENKRSLISRNQIELSKQEKLDPLGRYTKVLKRSLEMDKREIEEQKKLQYSYLITTLNHYLICLKLFSNLSKKQHVTQTVPIGIIKNNSAPEIMITSKCLSYWFSNSNNDEVNKTLKKNLSQTPTYFFLPFVYQMAARMALTNEKLPLTFHSILLEYLSRCIVDHPHHVLPVIFALVNAHKDAHIQQQQQAASSAKRTSTVGIVQLNSDVISDARSRAAHYLLQECAKFKPQLVDQMRKMNDAYIEAAYWDAASGKNDQPGKDVSGKNPTFSKQLRLMHIKDFDEAAVPTITVPVSNDGIYENIETVKSFNPEYAMVGGVNAPKKIVCHSSAGRSLAQLLKGKDDLRQDAVMQQLFTVVNRLVNRDDLTCHRSLNIRTYNVVPLTQKSGVLEWCEGTITFGDYLTKDPDGAHARYHPDDWAAMDCRRHVHKLSNASKDERRRAFIQTCSKLRPVFRYFFYEYYNQPSIWQKKKQAFAKSVAVSSIVGYIVGLGDRHVQNILIDKQTAEVIHIDLGVAFDQGKMLPIPETIPFRLTRDVIDGLGICGTEGLFKKTCEITLELMRQYADTLITIIEVFLYDPLYQWQLSPQKALQLQQQFDKTNDSVAPSTCRSSGKESTPVPPTPTSTLSSIGGEPTTTDTNKMAERLLLGLRQKLQGVERFNQMTIKAHVNMLIQEATSIDNLSQLFAGWQPYL